MDSLRSALDVLATPEFCQTSKNRPLFIENNQMGIAPENYSKRESANTRIVAVAKFLNDLLKNPSLDLSQVGVQKIVTNIDHINRKIASHNKKVENIFYRFLRALYSLIGLEKTSPLMEKISFAEPVSCSAANNILRAERDRLPSDLSSIRLENFVIKCEANQVEQILSQTEFVEHNEKWKGSIASKRINKEIIRQAGLEPVYRINTGSIEAYFSKVFQAYEIPHSNPPAFQMAAIAYVKENKNFKPRLLYLSGVDNLWRVTPIKDGMRYGKGLEVSAEKPLKASTNLPWIISCPLHLMQQRGDESTQIKLNKDNRDILNAIFNMLPDNTLNYMDDCTCTLTSRNASDDFRQAHVMESVDLTSELKIDLHPDFATVVKYTIPGIFSDQITAYSVSSINKEYDYLFYEAKAHGSNKQWQEDEPHVWLASFSRVYQELTSYLTDKKAINMHGADIAGAEYLTYVNLTEEQKLQVAAKMGIDVDTMNESTIIPTWDVRQNFYILKLFQDWKKR